MFHLGRRLVAGSSAPTLELVVEEYIYIFSHLSWDDLWNVRPPVHCVQCQHFHNPQTLRPQSQGWCNLASLFYGQRTKLLGSRILKFDPCAVRERWPTPSVWWPTPSVCIFGPKGTVQIYYSGLTQVPNVLSKQFVCLSKDAGIGR